MERFAYFTIRLRLPPVEGEGVAFSGVVERLGTGEKRAFDGVEDLVRVLTTPAADPGKMRAGSDGGNSDEAQQRSLVP